MNIEDFYDISDYSDEGYEDGVEYGINDYISDEDEYFEEEEKIEKVQEKKPLIPSTSKIQVMTEASMKSYSENVNYFKFLGNHIFRHFLSFLDDWSYTMMCSTSNQHMKYLFDKYGNKNVYARMVTGILYKKNLSTVVACQEYSRYTNASAN
jgi:hypothetical protein